MGRRKRKGRPASNRPPMTISSSGTGDVRRRVIVLGRGPFSPASGRGTGAGLPPIEGAELRDPLLLGAGHTALLPASRGTPADGRRRRGHIQTSSVRRPRGRGR